MAKGWFLSTAPTRRLLGNPVPPATEGSGPAGTLIFTLPGRPRTALQAEHSRLHALPFASGGLLPGPLLSTSSLRDGARVHPKSPDFAAWGVKNPNLKPIGSEAVLPRDWSPRLRGSGVSFWLSCFLGGRPEKSHHLSWSC